MYSPLYSSTSTVFGDTPLNGLTNTHSSLLQTLYLAKLLKWINSTDLNIQLSKSFMPCLVMCSICSAQPRCKQCWCPCLLSVNPNTVVSHLNGLTRPSVGLDLPRRTHDCHHQLQYHQHLLNHIPTPRILDSSSSPSGWSGSFTKRIFVPDFPVCKRLLIQEERGEIWNNRAGESARMGSFFLGLGVYGSGTLGV